MLKDELLSWREVPVMVPKTGLDPILVNSPIKNWHK